MEGGRGTMLKAMQAQRIVPMHDSATEQGIGDTLDDIEAGLPESMTLRGAKETQAVEG